MKTIIYSIIAIFLFGMLSCHPQEKKVTISISLNGSEKPNPVMYAFWKNKNSGELQDTLMPDENGKLIIEKTIDSPMWFWFSLDDSDPYFYFRKVLIQPGENQVISCDVQSKYLDPAAIEITGQNSDGQLIYFYLDNSFRGFDETGFAFDKYWSISDHESLLDSLYQKVDRIQNRYLMLLEDKRIDETFYQYSYDQARYFYAYQLSSIIWNAIHNQELVDQHQEYERILTELYNQFSVKDKGILNSDDFQGYIDLYIQFLIRMDPSDYNKQKSKNLGQTYKLSLAKQFLSDEAYKNFAVSYLWSRALWQRRETISLFERYKEDFPDMTNNRYYQWLEKDNIPSLKELYKDKNIQFSEDMKFLGIDKEITTFDDLVDSLKGKPLFIDCWATWCGPCIAQFKYNKALEEYLEENNIQMLYIVFDKDLDEQKWKSLINKHNLKGYHFTSNPSFYKDFLAVISENSSAGFGFPTYVLVSKNGDIINNNMKSPSLKKDLYKQIEMELQK